MENREKKRIFIVASDSSGVRLKRFKEEAEKMDLDLVVIDSYSCKLTERGVFSGEKEIVFKNSDVCWCISNSMINQYIARHIEERGVFVWPSAKARSFSDKFYTNSFFAKIGVKTPKTVLINSLDTDSILDKVKYVGGFPCIVKLNKGSMGSGVEMAKAPEDITSFIKETMKSVGDSGVPFKKISFQMQEFIEESVGEDFRVICLNGRVLGGMKRIANDGFKANISLGGSAEVFEVDENLQDICRRISKEGKVFYAGIDFVKGDDGYMAIEINSSSQFKGFEDKTGINVAAEIIRELIKD